MQWWASRRKHVGLKKLVVSSKEKRQIIIIKVFIPQVILLLTYFLVSYTDVRFLWMSCAVKDIIKLDIYIFNNNTLIIHIRYYFVYYILKITNKYHTNIRLQYVILVYIHVVVVPFPLCILTLTIFIFISRCPLFH